MLGNNLMRLILFRMAFIVMTAVVLSPSAHAQMALNKVVVDFVDPATRRDDIKITNTGKETLFVLVEPAQILNPDTEQQKRTSVRDPGKFGLLVTPNRFVLKAKQSKILRIVILKPAEDKDRIYRLSVKPVLGNVEAQQTAVKVVFGYDVLVIVRPATGKAAVSAKREGKSITFSNTGTTSALLTNGKQCDTAGKNCVEVPPKRLYAGNTWTVPLKFETPVEYYITERTDIRKERY